MHDTAAIELDAFRYKSFLLIVSENFSSPPSRTRPCVSCRREERGKLRFEACKIPATNYNTRAPKGQNSATEVLHERHSAHGGLIPLERPSHRADARF